VYYLLLFAFFAFSLQIPYTPKYYEIADYLTEFTVYPNAQPKYSKRARPLL